MRLIPRLTLSLSVLGTVPMRVSAILQNPPCYQVLLCWGPGGVYGLWFLSLSPQCSAWLDALQMLPECELPLGGIGTCPENRLSKVRGAWKASPGAH